MNTTWLERQVEAWYNHGLDGLCLAFRSFRTLNFMWILEAMSELLILALGTGIALLLTPFALIHILLEGNYDDDV